MNQTIKNYIETSEKEFEALAERFYEGAPVGSTPYFLVDVKKLKSFLHQRQVGLIELIRNLVPIEKEISKKFSTNERRYPIGFNSCRQAILEMLELVDK